MSAIQSPVRAHWRWHLTMKTWYQQLLTLVYGLGIMVIALWALEQGTGAYVILGVVGMSMLTLTLIFGVEVDSIRVLDKVEIEFTGHSDDDE